MAEMTEQEFADRLVHDKAFRKEVVRHCGTYEATEGAEDGLGEFFYEGAKAMGHESFNAATLDAAIKNQLGTLGTFKKITFLGSIINTARKMQKGK